MEKLYHVILVGCVIKRMSAAADDIRPEEEGCGMLKATTSLLGETLALQRIITSNLHRDDESEKEELENRLTEITCLETGLKAGDGR